MEVDSLCTACKRQDRESTGKKWCFHCKETLCHICCRAHSRNKFTFSHHLMSYKPTQIIKSMVKDRILEMPENTSRIESMAFADDGNLMILYTDSQCRWNESCLRFINADGQLIKQRNVVNNGYNIVNIPGTNRAVMIKQTQRDSVLQFIDTETMTLGRQIMIENEGKYLGLVYNNDVIYVGGEKELQIYNTEGRYLGSLEVANVEKSIKQLEHDKEGYIYLVDNEKVAKIDRMGKILFCYGSTSYNFKMFQELIACLVDQNGYIYVGGTGKENFVHQLSPDGMMVNDKICDEHIAEASSMCFNKDFSELYVANNKPNEIIVFKCNYDNV